MRLGLSVYDVTASELVDEVVGAELSGFDSLWLGEHVLLATGYQAVHPTRQAREERSGPIVGRETRLTDPLLALAAAAAVTQRIHLATGIYLVGLRHPLLTARAAVTLQDLAKGRFRLGVGAGWLREEFDALGADFEGRGPRMDEELEVIRLACGGGTFAHRGEHYGFDAIQVSPDAVPVPLIVGGNSPPALRRAARLGDGWFASGNPTFAEAVALRDRVLELRRAMGVERPFSVTVRVSNPLPGDIGRYEAEGFDELIFWTHEVAGRGGDRRAALRRAAESLGVDTPVAPPDLARPGPSASPSAHASTGAGRETL